MSLSTSPLRTRLLKGVSAHGAMQAILLATRILEVPIFIGIFGAAAYGEWLTITAVGAIFVLCDIGLVRTSQRQVATLVAKEDAAAAQDAADTCAAGLTMLALLVLYGIYVVVQFAPLAHILKVQTIDANELGRVLFILIAQVMLNFQSGLVAGTFAAFGRQALGTAIHSTSYAMGFAGMVLAAYIFRSFESAAWGLFVGHFVGFFALALAQKKCVTQIKYRLRAKAILKIGAMTPQAASSSAFPVGETINLQGIRLIVGSILGPAAVAQFAIVRTLCRMALQPIMGLGRAIEPEISRAFGSDNSNTQRILFVNSVRLAFWAAVVLALAVAVLGPFAFRVWTRNSIELDRTLFYLLLVGSIFGSLWTVSISALSGINQQGRAAGRYVLVYGIGAIVAAIALGNWFGLIGVVISVTITEVCVSAFSLTAACAAFSVGRADLLKAIFSIRKY